MMKILENVRITCLRSEVCRSNKLAEVLNTETENRLKNSLFVIWELNSIERG